MSTVARIALAHFEPLSAERFIAPLRRRAHSACAIASFGHPGHQIERLSPDLLIIDISSEAAEAKTTLNEAVRLRRETGLRPLVLCVSRRYKGARFHYEIERMGVRLVSSLDVEQVLRTVDLMLFELARVDQNGPDISIIHRYRLHVDGAQCQAGEEIARVVASYQGRQETVPLSLATRLCFDYFARTKHSPQSAIQIAGHMRTHPFYRLHGMNCGVPSTRKISKSCIKEYAKRIRGALGQTFKQLSLPLDPDLVLVTQLAGNEARYVLRASIEWVHVNDLEEHHPRVRRVA